MGFFGFVYYQLCGVLFCFLVFFVLVDCLIMLLSVFLMDRLVVLFIFIFFDFIFSLVYLIFFLFLMKMEVWYSLMVRISVSKIEDNVQVHLPLF